MRSLVCSWIYDSGAASSAGRCSGLFDLYLGAAQTQAQYLSEHFLWARLTPTLGRLHTSLLPLLLLLLFLLLPSSPTLGGPCLIMPDPHGPADLQRQTVTDGAVDLICAGRPRYIIPMSRVPFWEGLGFFFYRFAPLLKHAVLGRFWLLLWFYKKSDLTVASLLDNYHG